jgi:hypothetical protein
MLNTDEQFYAIRARFAVGRYYLNEQPELALNQGLNFIGISER